MIAKSPCPLWKHQELFSVLDLEYPTSFAPVGPVIGISMDTRTLKAGDLFVALRGKYCDGHDLLDQAFACGAVGAIVDRKMHDDARTVCVPDARKTLWDLGYAARQRYSGCLLAVTGSTGKTTIKEGLRHVLCQQQSCFASRGSFNNDLGVSVSLSNLPADAHWGVFELGMNRPKEIQDLVHKVRPHIAMVNNISYQHSENFRNLDAIAQAKAEIFSAPSVHTAILWRDCPYFSFMQDEAKSCGIRTIITFGKHIRSTVRILSVQPIANNMVKVHACLQGRELLYTLPDLGDYWIMNSAGVLAGVLAMKGCVVQASRDLVSFTAPPGRGQQLTVAGITIVDDSYNAAPAAVEKALRCFARRSPSGKKHVLLGEMRELGIQEKAMHEALVPLINQSCDDAWLCGAAFQSIVDRVHVPCHYAVSVRDLMMPLLKTLRPGDALLVKGARGTETFAIVYALYKMYGDIEGAMSYPLLSYLTPDMRNWIDERVERLT
jgi:UDP-N-acetylmuramoyl-tripeptide--D-alanyl-D-alanine ligase